MNKTDEKKFNQLLLKVCAAFGYEQSAAGAKEYFECLNDFPIEQIEPALDTCKKVCKFFPKIAEIIEQIENISPYEDEIEKANKYKYLIHKKSNEKLKINSASDNGVIICKENKIFIIPYQDILRYEEEKK